MGPDRRRGVLLVLCGTSGAGKGTVGKALRAADPKLGWSVSWTTRPPRPGELDGREYHFVSREQFEALLAEAGFLEWFEVYGRLYGTPKQFVLDELAAGRDVMLEIDVQGALAIKEQLPEALLVFVQAPSRAEQRRRLIERGTDAPEAIERRLAAADEEEHLGRTRFDAVVVNDQVDRAAGEIAGILGDRRSSPAA